MQLLRLLLLLWLAPETLLGEGTFSTIESKEGGSITAEVLKEKSGRTVVDLGFKFLEVSQEAVSRILKHDADPTESTGGVSGDRLYSLALGSGSERPIKELLDRYGEAVMLVRTPTYIGSGFLIHPEGYLVTNDHVIAGENKISATLYERRAKETVKVSFDKVRIVAESARFDLALLKIQETGGRVFQVVALGDSGQLRSGQEVFAIGSPLGLERTVSEGIISLKNRLIGEQLYIQILFKSVQVTQALCS